MGWVQESVRRAFLRRGHAECHVEQRARRTRRAGVGCVARRGSVRCGCEMLRSSVEGEQILYLAHNSLIDYTDPSGFVVISDLQVWCMRC